MKYVFTLLLLVFAVPAFAQDTPTLKDLSPSFKEPAQDAFDTVQRFTETSESVKLDTQKALAKAKHNITTDADRYAYKLLEAQFNSQSAFDGWHDYARELLTKSEGKDKEGHYLPAEDRDPSISNLYSKQFHETLDLATPFGVGRTQCKQETSAIFDSDFKKTDTLAPATCLNLYAAADAKQRAHK